MLFTRDDGAEVWLFTGFRPHRICGTSLFYRKDWWQKHKFRAANMAEDVHFVDEAVAHGQLDAETAQYRPRTNVGDFEGPLGPIEPLMRATIHSGNTVNRNREQLDGQVEWSLVASTS